MRMLSCHGGDLIHAQRLAVRSSRIHRAVRCSTSGHWPGGRRTRRDAVTHSSLARFKKMELKAAVQRLGETPAKNKPELVKQLYSLLRRMPAFDVTATDAAQLSLKELLEETTQPAVVGQQASSFAGPEATDELMKWVRRYKLSDDNPCGFSNSENIHINRYLLNGDPKYCQDMLAVADEDARACRVMVAAGNLLPEETGTRRQVLLVNNSPSHMCTPGDAPAFMYDGTNNIETAPFVGFRIAAPPPAQVIPLPSVAPEFGIIQDAGQGVGTPTEHFRKAAHELCWGACDIYSDEKERQRFFQRWLSRTFYHLQLCDFTSSSNNSGEKTVFTEGQFLISVSAGGSPHPVFVSEVKNEFCSSGDPQFQAMRYYQMNINRSLRSDWLKATASPAIGMMMVGPLLYVVGFYVNYNNQVVSRPLCAPFPLLAPGLCATGEVKRLARVLTATGIALHNIVKRLQTAAGEKVSLAVKTDETTMYAWQAAIDDFEPEYQLALQQFRSASSSSNRSPSRSSSSSRVDYAGWLEAARLDSKQLWSSASARGQSTKAVPYCLWASSQHVGVHLTDVQQLLGSTTNPVYEAKYGDQPVVVKVLHEQYPAHVHDAAAAAGLAPRLLHHELLPGGGCFVVMEQLGPDWQTLKSTLGPHYGANVKNLQQALTTTVNTFHALSVTSTSGDALGSPVHCDLRPPNIMVKCTNGKYMIRLIDLDMSGIAGIERYSESSDYRNPGLPWHSDVRPGAVKLIEHDTYMLHRSCPQLFCPQ